MTFLNSNNNIDSLFLVGVQSLFLLPSLNQQNSAQHTKGVNKGAGQFYQSFDTR